VKAWNNGVLEYWNVGYNEKIISQKTHDSSIPSFHDSIPMA
jgi:hypothetical protein